MCCSCQGGTNAVVAVLFAEGPVAVPLIVDILATDSTESRKAEVAQAAIERHMAGDDRGAQVFDETRIPTGDAVEITADMSLDQQARAATVNEIVREMAMVAAGIRWERQQAGHRDSPPQMRPPRASARSTIVFDFMAILSLIGSSQDTFERRQLGSRHLQDYTNGDVAIDIRAFMAFVLVRGDGAADERFLGFNPSLSSFDGSRMTIKFDFDYPLEVSKGREPDKVVAFFTDPRLLLDSTTGMFIQNDGIAIEMPRQFLRSPGTDVLQAACDVASTATGTLLILSILLALSLTAMTKSIWTFINIFQVLAYLRYFVDWSANAALGFQCMDYSISGRLQTDFIWAAWDVVVSGSSADSDTTAYESARVKLLVDDTSVLRSTGIYPIVLAVIVLLMIYAGFLSCCKNASLGLNHHYKQLRRKLYWNSLLRFYLEVDLKLAHQALAVSWFLGAANTLQFSVHAFLGGFLVVAPICILWFLLAKQDDLEDREVYNRFSTLYEGIRADSKPNLLYTVVFLVRRIALVCTCIFLYRHEYFKVMIFLWMEGFYLIYVGWNRPHVEPVYNQVEKINEVILLLVGYLMLLNTDWLTNQYIRYYVGWAALFLGFVLYIFNFLVLLGVFIVEVQHIYKMYTIRRKFILAYGRKEMIEENYYKTSKDSGPRGATRGLLARRASRDDYTPGRRKRRRISRKSGLV